jgi:inositol-hexakisphosphate/diphosphoinositol-pentakisphosphate 1-kinase
LFANLSCSIEIILGSANKLFFSFLYISNLASEPASIVPSSNNSEEGSKSKIVKVTSGTTLSSGQHQEELRCVIAVIRHGDRTPKQKLKVKMTEPLILEYFHKHNDDPKKDLKIKAKQPMTEFLDTVKTMLNRLDQEAKQAAESGNKKKVNKKLVNQLRHMRDVLERWKITGLNRKLQIKPLQFNEDLETGQTTCTEVQLILKWGGNLTKLGEKQAITLGKRTRQEMYPDSPGGGILRLHSTFRHDLKIKTSDEGRVMKTAAAFAKGMLELEGEIPPILVSLVHKEKGSMHMLDPSGDKEVKLELDECKEKITANLQKDIDYRETTEEDREKMVGPASLVSLNDALAEVGNPRKALMEIYKTMGSLIEQLEEMLDLMGSGDEKLIEGGEGLKGDDEEDVALSGVKLYKGETLLELTERWRFIYKRLYDADEDVFDLSRIPDVHDNVRFDVLHNPHLGLSSTLEKLYELAKSMADCVVPQEYGTTIAEKRSVGVKICSSLLEKVMYDLNIARTDNKVDMRYMINMDYSADLPINTMGRRIRTRLYFTSESHLHTMLNVLRFAGGDEVRPLLSEHGYNVINNARELCYLTQIFIRLFEDTQRSMEDPRRFRVEILFSPGATATPLHIDEANRDADLSRFDTAPLQQIGREGLTCKEVEDFLGAAIMEGRKDGEDDLIDVASASTGGLMKRAPEPGNIPAKISHVKIEKGVRPPGVKEEDDENEEYVEALDGSLHGGASLMAGSLASGGPVADIPIATNGKGEATDIVEKEAPVPAQVPTNSAENGDTIPKDEESKKNNDRSVQIFWSAIAAGSLLLGAGCIMMALSLSDRGRPRRRYTAR